MLEEKVMDQVLISLKGFFFILCIIASSLITNVPLQVERIGWVGALVYVVISGVVGLYLPALILHRIILIIKGRMKHES